MSDVLKIQLAQATDTGKVREHNEDDLCVVLGSTRIEDKILEATPPVDNGILLAVADGMGGMSAGEVASAIAIETVEAATSEINLFEEGKDIPLTLKKIIDIAHKAILSSAKGNPDQEGMGTTIILAHLSGNTIHLAWSGDSRAYLFNAEGLEREQPYDLPRLKILTDDHSMVWQHVMSGGMDAEQARTHEYGNIITQSLGDPANPPAPDTVSFKIKAGDQLLMCSDGLNGMLPDQMIEAIMAESEDVEHSLDALIESANDAGGNDNITAILVRILSAPALSEDEILDARPEVVTLVSRREKMVAKKETGESNPPKPQAGTQSNTSGREVVSKGILNDLSGAIRMINEAAGKYASVLILIVVVLLIGLIIKPSGVADTSGDSANDAENFATGQTTQEDDIASTVNQDDEQQDIAKKAKSKSDPLPKVKIEQKLSSKVKDATQDSKAGDKNAATASVANSVSSLQEKLYPKYENANILWKALDAKLTEAVLPEDQLKTLRSTMLGIRGELDRHYREIEKLQTGAEADRIGKRLDGLFSNMDEVAKKIDRGSDASDTIKID